MSWWPVARRELGSAFSAPLAWVLLALFLLLSGYFFVAVVVDTQTADLGPVLQNMAVLLLFLGPLLTMRLLAEERRLGTDELILTSPISPAQWVLGKYAGAFGVWTVFLAVTVLFPVALARLGSLDVAATFGGYVGLWLVGGALLAAGLFASSLTDNQVVAAMVAFALALLFWASSWAAGSLSGRVADFLQYISLPDQYTTFAQGVIDTSHVVFLLSLIAGFLFLTVRVVDARRWV